MARIRTIKPEFWTDEKIVELSPWARLLFLGLLNFADDDGRMVYSPKRIKMQIFPADPADMSALFGELRREKLVIVYAVENTEYLAIMNFTKHQKTDKRTASKLPPPPKNMEPRRITPSPADGRDQGRDQGREGNSSSILGRLGSAREAEEAAAGESDGDPPAVASVMRIIGNPNIRVRGDNGTIVQEWLEHGWSLNDDILPAITDAMVRAPPDLRSLRWFTPVIEAHNAQRNGRAEGGYETGMTRGEEAIYVERQNFAHGLGIKVADLQRMKADLGDRRMHQISEAEIAEWAEVNGFAEPEEPEGART